MRILVNLPAGFFTRLELKPIFGRLHQMGQIRCTSYDTPEQIAEDLCWAQAVIMWSWPTLSEQMLDRAKDLQYLGQIDVDCPTAKAAMERGIAMSLSKGGWSPAVAELALGLMLSCLRKTSEYHIQMRSATETWVENFPTDIDGNERQLTGRSVGIVGLGRIGQRLAQLLQPFNITLHVTDPYVSDAVLKKYQAKRVSIDELCEMSEVLVLCAAENDGTRKVIDEDQIQRLRKQAVFINVARSALVDYHALAKRLEQGDVIAALDVFDEEPLSKDHVLRNLPNTYLTPHRGGGLVESLNRCVGWLVDDLQALQRKERRLHAMDQSMLIALGG